jgi:HlyD family secretion protein
MRKNKLIRYIIGMAAATLIMASMNACAADSKSKSAKAYRFGVVTKGSVEKTVSSSGNLEPVSTVSVISQMSGRVEKVNADYNDTVKKGQVLIELNTDMLRLEETQQRANVKKIQSGLDLARIDYGNKAKLAAKGLISDYDLTSAKTSFESLEAELASAQASLSVVETKIKDYAYIKSPIDGIVLEKNVDLGQSVVEGSSSNSASLYTLSEGLSRMEIKAKVDELDIAAIKKGLSVRFTVEALPDKTFSGTVTEIRLVPESSNNVVNYYVMASADNSSGALLPGMTAEVIFIQSLESDVLLVPNAALRYAPSSLSAAQIKRKTFIAGLSGLSTEEKEKAVSDYDVSLAAVSDSSASAKKQSVGGLTGMIMGGAPSGGAPGAGGMPGSSANKNSSSSSNSGTQSLTEQASSQKTLWYLNDAGELEVALVLAGTTDGGNTVVSGSLVSEGFKAIVQEEVK